VCDVTRSITGLSIYVYGLKRKGSSKRQELQVTAFLSWFSSPSLFKRGLSLVQTPGKARHFRSSRRD
jgi:hypothetical protein